MEEFYEVVWRISDEPVVTRFTNLAYALEYAEKKEADDRITAVDVRKVTILRQLKGSLL